MERLKDFLWSLLYSHVYCIYRFDIALTGLCHYSDEALVCGEALKNEPDYLHMGSVREEYVEKISALDRITKGYYVEAEYLCGEYYYTSECIQEACLTETSPFDYR